MSRTPHAGLRRCNCSSNAALVGAVCAPPRRYGPYRKSTPPGPSSRPAPPISACADAHGEIWIMLMQTIAAAASMPHDASRTSSASGGRTLASPLCAVHAAIDARASSSRSLGCQTRCGSAAAKWIACWPVPLAISSTVPVAGRTRSRTARIGSRLRSAEGACWRRLRSGVVMAVQSVQTGSHPFNEVAIIRERVESLTENALVHVARARQARALDMARRVPQLRARQRFRAMKVHRVDIDDQHRARRLAVDREALEQRRFDRNAPASIDAQRLADTRHDEQQPHMRIDDHIAQTVDSVVADAIGNRQRARVDQ